MTPQVDPKLLRRLWRPVTRPGLIDRGLGASIVARHTRMVTELSLAERLHLRAQLADDVGSTDLPLVTVHPPEWTGVTPLPASGNGSNTLIVQRKASAPAPPAAVPLAVTVPPAAIEVGMSPSLVLPPPAGPGATTPLPMAVARPPGPGASTLLPMAVAPPAATPPAPASPPTPVRVGMPSPAPASPPTPLRSAEPQAAPVVAGAAPVPPAPAAAALTALPLTPAQPSALPVVAPLTSSPEVPVVWAFVQPNGATATAHDVRSRSHTTAVAHDVQERAGPPVAAAGSAVAPWPELPVAGAPQAPDSVWRGRVPLDRGAPTVAAHMALPLANIAAGHAPAHTVHEDRPTRPAAAAPQAATSARVQAQAQVDVDAIVDTVHRRFLRRLAVEAERRAVRW